MTAAKNDKNDNKAKKSVPPATKAPAVPPPPTEQGTPVPPTAGARAVASLRKKKW